MSFSVVIPSKNATNLEACVWTKLQMEPHAVPLIVVDDGLERIPECCDGGTILKGKKPFVFSVNCNIGIREALEDKDCSGVILLNDDALLETPGGFSAMAKAAEEAPDFGIVGAVTNLTGQPLQWRKNVGLRQVPHFAFVCVYLPRRTIEKVGYLDERYCLDYGVEDRDYCEAVNRAGLRCGVYDFCFVDHGSLSSSFRGDPKAPRSFQQNYGLFKAKWGIPA